MNEGYKIPEEIPTEETLEGAPDGWMTINEFCEDFSVTSATVKKELGKYREEHREWLQEYLAGNGRPHEYLSPELLDKLRDTIGEKVPDGWLTIKAVANKLQKGHRTIQKFVKGFRSDNPDWFLSRRRYEYLSPELIELIESEFSQEKYNRAPDGWVSYGKFSEDLSTSVDTISNIAEKHRELHPEWFKEYANTIGRVYEYLSPELADIIKKELSEHTEAPVGWLTSFEVSKKISRAQKTIQRIAETFRDEHEDWFNQYKISNGRLLEHYSPELISVIEKYINIEELKERLREFAEEVNGGEKLEAQKFRRLVGLFGSSRAIDILFKFRPEFKGLPIQYVKSMIADYIGEFLVLKHGFRGQDILETVGYLNDQNLRTGLLEIMKESCLEYYHRNKKSDPVSKDGVIIEQYIGALKKEVGQIDNEELNSVIDDLSSYYADVLSIEKPQRIIDEIKPGREFPDINQKINIKEIQDKKKILIADDMGLGKSASAILTKEVLGVKQALVIVPSNVVDTWQGYLRDYFKPGEEPKVLVVDNIENLREDLSEYEYVLISHERITDEYTEELLNLSPGMIIVDEIHKFKNIKKGVRAQNLLALAEQIEGEGKYLAALSGTPVPNKIVDVAMVLKILYPEKFKHLDSKEMAESIMKGDLIDLRSLLIPRMQMKSLKESVEMPQHIENKPTMVELSGLERELYGVLLEEDELTATQKIQLLRQFVLNPEIIDATPGIQCSKSAELEKSLNADFDKVDKIVVFVNGYVEGVIRGDKSIIPRLNLPEDVEVRVIEGEVSKKDREDIQRELNTSDKKMLLLVSGQTADVGVDFSGGEMVYFYNDPWTEYDKAQQLSRVYRPGLKHDLESKTFITRGTIEEGISRFIAIKKRSVEKLLKGVPLTELDKEILEQTEKQPDDNREVNPELAQYYFNSWDRLMKIFAEVREIGEKEFMSYLDQHGKEFTHGEEYAKAYFDLGSRSYQSNANRIAGTLIHNFMEEARQEANDVNILDLASGPEMLKRHSLDELGPRITSIDVNPAHFSRTEGDNRIVGQITALPFSENAFDYINLTFALHYSRFVPTRGQIERLEIFKEMNRVLKKGGRVIIDLVYSVDVKDFEAFKENIKSFGLQVVDNYTGEIQNESLYKSKIITLEKFDDLSVNFTVEGLIDEMSKEQRNSFKFHDVKGKLKDSRRIITNFKLGDREFEIRFNEADQKTYNEEQSIITKAEDMKVEHGGIADIPADEIIDNLFVRYRPKDSYRLFKRLKVTEGGVVVK